MSFEKKWTLIKIITLGVGFGTVIFTGRALTRAVLWWRFVKHNNKIQNFLKSKLKNPLETTRVVSCISEWDKVYPLLLRDSLEIPIFGFDCEWISLKGKTQPVALIQIASYRGVCALVRVCCLPTIPETLKSILGNPNILKVGVATWEDSLKLKKDLGIKLWGGYDVRHLIFKHPNRTSLYAKSGLSGLSQQLLDVELNKHFSVRCSDWEAENLSDIQITYASQDALASLAVCLQLIADTRIIDTYLWSFFNVYECYGSWVGSCAMTKDTKFRFPSNYITSGGFSIRKSIDRTTISTQKNSHRCYATRKTVLYDNCILQAPDGQQLCTCDYKKAMWYVAKGRGYVVSHSPMAVRLNFEPSGRPSTEYDQYYLTEKANVCVVCGNSESFLRKNIVPHEYRKHFPEFLKDHKSHDILLLCLKCHTVCSNHDISLKQHLAIKCDAPIGTERDVKTKLDRRLSGVQKAANALFFSRNTIPSHRATELEEIIKDYYKVQTISSEVIEMARNLEIHVPNADYVPHGLKVVRYFEEQENGLLKLERIWREHFLQTMQPCYLPALWSVEHSRSIDEKWQKLERV